MTWPMTMWVSWMRGVSRVRVDAEQVIDALGQLAAAAAGEPDGDDAERAARVDGAQHVGGVAAGGDREGDVAAAAERLDLLGEHLVVAEVVGDAGQRRGVGRQRDRRQRRALELEAVDELGRQVLGVGGAAAVAEEEQLVTVASASRSARPPAPAHRLAAREIALRRRARGEDAPDLAPHRGGYTGAPPGSPGDRLAARGRRPPGMWTLSVLRSLRTAGTLGPLQRQGYWMKTLFLNPPSYDDFDGGAGSRYQATREVWSFWYPTWLCYPAGMIPGQPACSTPRPSTSNQAQTVAHRQGLRLRRAPHQHAVVPPRRAHRRDDQGRQPRLRRSASSAGTSRREPEKRAAAPRRRSTSSARKEFDHADQRGLRTGRDWSDDPRDQLPAQRRDRPQSRPRRR